MDDHILVLELEKNEQLVELLRKTRLMVDKGYHNKAYQSFNIRDLITPCFTYGKTQLTAEEALESRKVSSGKSVVENVHASLKRFLFLRNQISIQEGLHCSSKWLHFAAGIHSFFCSFKKPKATTFYSCNSFLFCRLGKSENAFTNQSQAIQS